MWGKSYRTLLLATITCCAFLANCDSNVITIDSVNITPPGGYDVATLTAEIHASASGTHTIKAEWKWHGQGSSVEEVVKTEYITMDHDGNYYSEYSASSGYVLLNYYWIELFDDDGILLKKASEVFCY
ncbi:hypothetical protein JXM67_08305 [candidate division WOR-3 bacterium]|nr:hypothetical protein [candidate division WOR-3 bacterium]